MDFTHVHASMHHAVSTRNGRKDVAAHREISDLVTLTETSGRTKIRWVNKGGDEWDNFRPSGSHGKRQNTVTWRTSVFEKAGDGWAERLSPTRWKTKGGGLSHYCYATVQPLRHLETGRVVWVIAAHPPAHIQQGGGWRESSRLRVKCAQESIEHVGALARKIREEHPDDAILFTADFNLDVKRKWIRRYLSKALAPLSLVWDGFEFPNGGTLGKRVIDTSYVFGLTVDGEPEIQKRLHADHKAVRVEHSFEPLPVEPVEEPEEPEEPVEEPKSEPRAPHSRGKRVNEALVLVEEALAIAEKRDRSARTRRLTKARDWLRKI